MKCLAAKDVPVRTSARVASITGLISSMENVSVGGHHLKSLTQKVIAITALLMDAHPVKQDTIINAINVWMPKLLSMMDSVLALMNHP